MNNIEEIKKQIAELVLKVDELEKNENDGVYHFTKDEIHVFVMHLHEGFLKSLKYNLTDLRIDEDCVDLSLYDKTLEVEINTDRIVDGIMDCIDMDLDRDSVEDTVNNIYKNIKS